MAVILPVGPLLVALAYLARGASGGSGGLDASGMWVVFVWIVRVLLSLGLWVEVSGAVDARSLDELGRVELILAFFVFPDAWIRHGLVRLGLVRLSCYAALAFVPARTLGDPGGGALWYAARALRAGWWRDAGHAWVLEAVRGRHWTSGCSLLVLAEAAVNVGEHERARVLFEAADRLTPRWPHRSARRIARSWRVADAAERGDWDAVIAIGRHRDAWFPSPWVLAAAADRLRGRYVPDILLSWGLVFASHRLALLPWVRRAHRAARVPPVHDAAGPWSLHRHVLAGAGTLEDLVALDAAWARFRVEPGVWPDEVRERVLADAETDLVGVMRGWTDEVPLTADPSGVLGRAVDRVWEERQARVVSAARRFANRSLLAAPDGQEEVWIAWTALRASWASAVSFARPDRRRWLFDTCWQPVCDHAVAAANLHLQRFYANDVFRWLQQEAILVGSPDAAPLLSRNVVATVG